MPDPKGGVLKKRDHAPTIGVCYFVYMRSEEDAESPFIAPLGIRRTMQGAFAIVLTHADTVMYSLLRNYHDV